MRSERDLLLQLRQLGIRNSEELLKAGSTALDRYGLAAALGVEVESVEQLVNETDLRRVRGLDEAGIRLLSVVGITNLQGLARAEPDWLWRILDKAGMSNDEVPPDAGRVECWVLQAAHLPRRVWE